MNVLYRLLSNPECIEPLRHNVETAVAEEGWTKAGMDKMHMIDSFVRETQRLDDMDGCPLDLPGLTPVTNTILFQCQCFVSHYNHSRFPMESPYLRVR